MKSITTTQVKVIHALLSKLKLMDRKEEIVFQFSKGRVVSTRELNTIEAQNIINHLNNYDSKNRMRRKVFALAYEAGFIYGESPEDKRMNTAKLNKILIEKGTVKKTLNEMNSDELLKTVNQFQQILKHTNESTAIKKTNAVLTELGIKKINQ